MGRLSVWKGSPDEAYALILAIDNNCDCVRGTDGKRSRMCGAHQAMNDQHFMDYVLFLRRVREYLLAEEHAGG